MMSESDIEVCPSCGALPCDQSRQSRWRTMESAPKDGRYILAIVAPDRGFHLQHQAGRLFVIRHEGLTEPGGYDMGWAVYPGFGGCSDFDFTHWMPAPELPERIG